MSANSGDEIYNRALLTGQTPDGSPLRAERSTGQLPGGSELVGDPAWTNPSATVSAAGWSSLNGGSVARDTGVFDTSPASIRVDSGSPIGFVHFAASFTGAVFEIGRTYYAKFRLRGAGMDPAPLVFGDAAAGDVARGVTPGAFGGVFVDVVIPWTPSKDRAASGVTLTVGAKYGGGSSLYVDTCSLEVSSYTLADRRHFRRAKELPISAALPDDLVAANLIADTWLAGHRTTPFKGTRTLIGDGSIRDLQTGQNIGLHTLGLKTMELIRFSDHIDPDTGDLGRDGRMTKVKYNHAEDTAEVTIDNSRASFEALLARFAVVTGSG